MSFLTAGKKDHVASFPRGEGGGKTYLGNARLKTFFFVCTPSLMLMGEKVAPHQPITALNCTICFLAQKTPFY